jgi:hypothetical protein
LPETVEVVLSFRPKFTEWALCKGAEWDVGLFVETDRCKALAIDTEINPRPIAILAAVVDGRVRADLYFAITAWTFFRSWDLVKNTGFCSWVGIPRSEGAHAAAL